MKKRLKGKVLLVSFLFLIFSGLLIDLSAGIEYCFNYDCLGYAGCLLGFNEFIGCTKFNACIGGGTVQCEKPPPQ
jgi:hypothetical protein